MKSDYKTPEFLAKNPVGYLPFLEDGDFALAESAAIAEYGELQSFFSGYVLVVSMRGEREDKRKEEMNINGRSSTRTHHSQTPTFMMIHYNSVIPV
jgi:hypothetical protein